MLPNFLIIGAARSGTTTLYSYLQQHADIYLPASKRPEPHFFFKASEYARGLDYYEGRYFCDWDGQRAVGEASTSYIFGAETPRRIHDCLPQMRMIAMLRNPVDRAFSGYWHTVKSGLESLDFSQAIETEDERTRGLRGTDLDEVKPYSYVDRGRYGEQLQRWFEYFDRSQVHVILFEDFVVRPRESLIATLQFLGVDADQLPARLDAVENKSVADGVTVPPEMRRRLADVFAPDVRIVEKLLNRDLSHWLS